MMVAHYDREHHLDDLESNGHGQHRPGVKDHQHNSQEALAPTGWANPIFRRTGRNKLDKLPPHQRAEKRQELLAKGAPPSHMRLNPLKAAKITWKSNSTLSGWSNILWPAVPAGIALWYTKRHEYPLAVFILNYVAMIPAANLLAFASGELAQKLPKTIGETVAVLMGAVVEIIVCMILLFEGQYDVVRAALLGSMLANLLLVTGTCFFAGGLVYREQKIAEYVTEVSGAALLVSAVGVLLPSQFYQAIYPRVDVGAHEASIKVLQVSRIVSIGLLIAYGCFLFFQLKTHSTSFHQVIEKAEEGDVDFDKERFRPKLSLLEALILTLVALVFVTFAAFFLIKEIPYLVEERHISDPFVGLILVPVVEKAAEHFLAIDEAWDNQLDLALSHTLGATIQTALLVSPLVVIVSWIAGREMDLNFEYFMAFALLLAVLVVGNFVRDRKTNWLEGGFLLMIYFVVAVSAFYYPNPSEGEGRVDEGVTSHEGSAAGGEGGEATTTAAAALEAATHEAARLLFGR